MPKYHEFAGPHGSIDKHSATSLPDLSFKVEQEPEVEAVDIVPAVTSTENKKSPTELARDDMTSAYQGLTTKEIQNCIQQEFFEKDLSTGNAKIEYSTDRNGNTVPNGIGTSGAEKATNLRLFNHARRLERLSTEHAKRLGANREKEKRVEKARISIHEAVDESIHPIEEALNEGKLSISLYTEASTVEEIDKLTSYWVEKGYVRASENELGETIYQTPKSAQIDKGKLVTGNSVLDLRQEALSRIAKKLGNSADLAEPVVLDYEPATAVEDLIKLEPFEPTNPGDSITLRLNSFQKAFDEAGDDSDQLEAVIGQAFRQGILSREVIEDPETGDKHTAELKAFDSATDTWYRNAMKHYHEVISHSDEEQEAAEQETFYPYTDKSSGWIKSRLAMFKRRG